MKQSGFQFVNKKSLFDVIAEVNNSKATKAEKVIALKAAGLRDKEIDDMLRAVASAPKAKKFTYTFGVEIECYHANKHELLQGAMASGLKMKDTGYTHEDNHEFYKIVPDASLQGNDNNEVVSPILKGGRTGLASIKKVTEVLRGVNAKVNKSCGLHVHISCPEMTPEHYINVFKNYQKLEQLINSFMPASRRDAMYSRSLKHFNFSNCHTYADVQHKMGSRYYNVNPMSWSRHNTIEFRQHSGTVEYEKISNWVKFLAGLVEYSRNNVFEADVTSVDDVPFLKDAQKKFYKARIEHFANM